MGFFDHEHRWFPKTALNTVHDPDSPRARAGLIVEGCRCGMVRTVEFGPGIEPVVRYARTEGVRGTECNRPSNMQKP